MRGTRGGGRSVDAIRCAAATLLCGLAIGCGAVNPPGFDRLSRSEPLAVRAAPGHLYGLAPVRWILDDGRGVRVDAERAYVISSGGLRHADLAFRVAWEDRSQGWLRCETDPSGPLPRTRFGCWSRSHRFWMASCAAATERVMETLTSPDCWKGELEVSGRRYFAEYGLLAGSGAAIDRMSWIDSTGTTVLAADMISELRIDLFPAAASSGSYRDALILQTVALHFWSHALASGWSAASQGLPAVSRLPHVSLRNDR